MRKGVDLKGEVKISLGCVENGLSASKAGIVDENGGMSDVLCYTSSNVSDGFGICQIAMEIVDVWSS